MAKHLVTFGEIMGRLAPEGNQRFGQAVPGSFRLTLAGAEANVGSLIPCLADHPFSSLHFRATQLRMPW